VCIPIHILQISSIFCIVFLISSVGNGIWGVLLKMLKRIVFCCKLFVECHFHFVLSQSYIIWNQILSELKKVCYKRKTTKTFHTFISKCFWRQCFFCHLFFGLYPLSLCFSTTTFWEMAVPSSSSEPTLMGPVDRASLHW
jgi:hypothetical protein